MTQPTTTCSRTNLCLGNRWSFWLWVATTVITFLIFCVLGTAWAVRHALTAEQPRLSTFQMKVVLALSEFPGMVRDVVNAIQSPSGEDPSSLLLDRKATERPQWVRQFPASSDSGYLLLSGATPKAKHAVVQQIRISDGVSVATWDPDWSAIYKKITPKKFEPIASLGSAYAYHPLLLPNGDIVFNTNTAMVRMSACSREPVWVLDEVMHHSNEFDQNGNIWSPSVFEGALTEIPWLGARMRDDALANISLDGHLIERRSFASIMLNNGLRALLLGTTGVKVNEDPIHLNQIKVAPQDTPYWKRGDMLISARHLSTVFLYRPSSDRILWHQTGPWMNQHSVDFVNDHQISIFDNNVVVNTPKEYALMAPDYINRVFLFDFYDNKLTQPYANLLNIAKPITLTGGRARILPDGGLFIEEGDYGRHLRFTHDKLLWSRISDYDEQRIAVSSWSRYLTSDEAIGPLKAMIIRKCAVILDSANPF